MLHRLCLLATLALVLIPAAFGTNVGKLFPSEKTSYEDPVTGRKITVLTTDTSGTSKPYQTHTTWTSDGQWIICRSNRGGNGSQAFLLNEQTGEMIQLTDGPATGTGSLNLSRKEMKLYFMRGGPVRDAKGENAATPPLPRQLIELSLTPLIADARAGTPRDASAYERIVATLPEELRDAGGFALDADESKAYWGVAWGPLPVKPQPGQGNSGSPATAAQAGVRRQIDDANTDPAEVREAARKRFAEAGKGPGGIRSIDLKTGEIKKVIDVEFRMGHVQTNPWVPGEIIYCHETTGDGPQRMWIVRGDGTGNRPLYVETPDEWITHETVSAPDEVMFAIMGHLPYLRHHPTGIAVINLRTNSMKIIGQVEEDMGGDRQGGFWHCNGSPDGMWAVADTFKGDVFLIRRKTGERILLTTDHKMRPDHTHPIFSPDSRRVLIQSGHLSDGKHLDLMTVDVPAVSPSTQIAAGAWDAPHAANPILPGYYADPSLVQHAGQNYLYATIDPWGGRTLGCWQSGDFKNWTFRTLNWPTKEACTSPTSSANSMVWAPSVVRAANEHFYMFVSVGSEVWVGTADNPLGPWADAHGGKPLIPGNYKPGFHMIDAEAFVDEDGQAYLYWGSGWDWKNGHCFAVKLKPDMVTFDGEPRDVTPGNYFEGPFMFKHAGRYYLSYSQGVTISDTYRVHYAIGNSPLGPFTEAPNSPILISDKARNIVSPGHHAIFSREGHDYIIYHRHSVPFVEGQAYRQTCVDELLFTPGGLIEPVIPTHTGPALVQRSQPDRLPATASASSELDTLHSAARVLDDNYATRWTAAPNAKGGWLQLDLGGVKPSDSIEIRFEYAWKTYRYTLEASADGMTWSTLSDQRTGGTAGSPITINGRHECRYLRLVYPDDVKGDDMSVWEFAAFAAGSPHP